MLEEQLAEARATMQKGERLSGDLAELQHLRQLETGRPLLGNRELLGDCCRKLALLAVKNRIVA
jgi:hypothetical protein